MNSELLSNVGPTGEVTDLTPPSRDSLSPVLVAVFDVLCDGVPHGDAEVRRAGVGAALVADFDNCVAAGTMALAGDGPIYGFAFAGAKSIAAAVLLAAVQTGSIYENGAVFGMTEAAAAAWKRALVFSQRRHVREPVTEQGFGEVRSFAGMTEWEGWAHAPLTSYDVAHVRPTLNVSVTQFAAAFPGWKVTGDGTGLISVMVPVGIPVKAILTSWLADNNILHDGVRGAKNVRRRDLQQLPQTFYADVISEMVDFGTGLVRKRHLSSMRRLGVDSSEVSGYVSLWVVELARTFNAALGRPFGTWVAARLPNKIQDLNRATFGRTIVDVETKHAKATADFQAEHNRNPSQEELRTFLGLTKERAFTERKHLGTSKAIGNPVTHFDEGDSLEQYSISTEPTPEEVLENNARALHITMSLLTVTGGWSPNGDSLKLENAFGFLAMYLTSYDEWVISDLAFLAGLDTRKSDEAFKDVTQRMRKVLDHLQ